MFVLPQIKMSNLMLKLLFQSHLQYMSTTADIAVMKICGQKLILAIIVLQYNN